MSENDSAFQRKWNYVCTLCHITWQMNYYDLLRLSDFGKMPCGCSWEHLGMPAEQPKHEVSDEQSPDLYR